MKHNTVALNNLDEVAFEWTNTELDGCQVQVELRERKLKSTRKTESNYIRHLLDDCQRLSISNEN